MRGAIFLILFIFIQINLLAQNDSVEENAKFEPVEIPAVYKGGEAAWKKYITQNLRYPKDAKRHFLPCTEQVITATFIVNKDSTVSEIFIKDDPGHGFREEVERLIVSGGKWQPCHQNGRDVRSYKTEKFYFKRPD